jgi:amidophosphoribosyltransferase
MTLSAPLFTNPFDDDKLREECGVFGVFGAHTAAAHTALGLHALQHRGQEAAGIVTVDNGQFHAHRALGLVGDAFASNEVMQGLVGDIAIGHVRYSTSGDTILRNVQPLFAEFAFGGVGIAHNGNLTNAYTLKKVLIERGAIFQSTSDTEVIFHLMALGVGKTLEQRLVDALKQVEGAYSLVVLGNDRVIGVRDPAGVRPLVLGKLGDAYLLASETCAFDIIGAQYVRDVAAGEMVSIDANGIHSSFPFDKSPSRFCIFEYIYFARPDSLFEDKSVYAVRKNIGKQLARESHVEADVIVPVPDSGVTGALGYAEQSCIPFELGIIRNHYVGRTFIEPTDHIRHLGVKLKHNTNKAYIKDKRVILVDDSIVRGTTSVKIVDMVRQAGAKEVHMRIASPPTTHSCFYGVDTPSRDKLMAAQHSIAEMAKLIGVDSLAFISLDGLYQALGETKRNKEMPQYCDACFTGEYPLPLTDHNSTTLPKNKKNVLKELMRAR